jgi:hypothetical protein
MIQPPVGVMESRSLFIRWLRRRAVTRAVGKNGDARATQSKGSDVIDVAPIPLNSIGVRVAH